MTTAMPDARLKVGIVSANWGALAHLPAWRLLGDQVEVTAICTSRRETAARAAEIQTIIESLHESDRRRAWVDIAPLTSTAHRPPSMGPDERNLIDNAEGADHD